MKQPLLFDEAPGELLAMMVDFLPMVQKFEAKYGSDNPQVKFYKRMTETLRRSLLYMNDVEYIYKRNIHLQQMNELLTERLHTVESRLALYEQIRANADNDTLAQMEKRVRERMQQIPEDPSFLTGDETTPEDITASFRRHLVNQHINHEEPKDNA